MSGQATVERIYAYDEHGTDKNGNHGRQFTVLRIRAGAGWLVTIEDDPIKHSTKGWFFVPDPQAMWGLDETGGAGDG